MWAWEWVYGKYSLLIRPCKRQICHGCLLCLPAPSSIAGGGRHARSMAGVAVRCPPERRRDSDGLACAAKTESFSVTANGWTEYFSGINHAVEAEAILLDTHNLSKTGDDEGRVRDIIMLTRR